MQLLIAEMGTQRRFVEGLYLGFEWSLQIVLRIKDVMRAN
jgi:hypothetical protein